jgi:TRAP-type mannitol/chloroaromatic compound transport system permease large subunit
MMFYLYVLQNQWIAITLLSGVMLTLIFCLTYQSMWHPRGVEQESEKVQIRGVRSLFKWLLSFVPWVVILLVLGSIAFTIATVVAKVMDPPNW